MKSLPEHIRAVLVTGAGGAVGRMVVDILLDESEATVVAVDLPGRMPKLFDVEGRIHKLEADLKPGAGGMVALHTLLEEVGVDAIINTAAIVDIAQPYSVVAPVNIGLPGELYLRAIDLGVRHFVHISSASIYAEPFPGDDIYPISEGFDVEGSSPYEWSKIHSEEMLNFLRETEEDAPALTILRPSLIYGPRCRFLGAALASIPAMLGKVARKTVGFSGGPRTNWVHCEDVARAAIHCIAAGEWTDQCTYNVCPAEAPGFGDVITEHMIARGLDVLYRVPLPQPSTLRWFRPILERDLLFSGLNLGIAGLWNLLGPRSNAGGLLVKVDREAVPYAFKHTIFSTDALLATGFEYKWSLEAGIADAMGWYQRNGWI
jgi:nucleoside-diphosphate-sugar epimerase